MCQGIDRDGSPSKGKNPYFALMHVLVSLRDFPIFFLFLSTNPGMQEFSPIHAHYPSLRRWRLIPPFFELPFDTFCYKFTEEAKKSGKLTLNGVCELEQMVKFGRSMWYAHHRSEIIYSDVALAALDCRILIRFDPMHTNARDVQAHLVKSFMRAVFNIPTPPHHMWSGYPSEAILAEAAARLLNPYQDRVCIKERAPNILESAVNNSFVASEERGELVARTLLTVAHDCAILDRIDVHPDGPRFHQPVRLVKLLEHLLAPDVWNTVKKASPVHAHKGDLSLAAAFEDAWVNFSHFAQLGDHDSFNLHCASELLKRGAAMQTFDSQYNMDGGLPLLFGDPQKTLVSIENTSIAQYLVKSASNPVKVFPEGDVVGHTTLPILSIVMHLGVETIPRVRIDTTEKDSRTTRSTARSLPTDINRRHYVISLYGCTSATYRCIPDGSKAYGLILKAQKPFADFPRFNVEANRSSVYALKPMIYDEKRFMPWS